MNLGHMVSALIFPWLGKLESPGGPIDILIGMDHMNMAPREHRGVWACCSTDQCSGPGMWCAGVCARQTEQTGAGGMNWKMEWPRCYAAQVRCSCLLILYWQKPWEQRFPGVVLPIKIARSSNAAWLVSHLKRMPSKGYSYVSSTLT